MSTPPDKVTKLSDTLLLSEYKTGGNAGFWLYDKTRGMNLAMRAKTQEEAFIQALTYYQNRLLTVETDYKSMKGKVDNFIALFSDDEYPLN